MAVFRLWSFGVYAIGFPYLGRVVDVVPIVFISSLQVKHRVFGMTLNTNQRVPLLHACAYVQKSPAQVNICIGMHVGMYDTIQ